MPFDQLVAHMQQEYNCCDQKMLQLAAKPPKGFIAYILKLAKKIWKEKIILTQDPVLIESYGKRLEEGILKGYNAEQEDIDWDTPDQEMLSSLEENAWQFSAAKTHTQLRDMSRALIGPDGKLRSWENYKIKVAGITTKQLGWLRTEYDTAIGGAQMAAKWVDIQRTKERFPLLQFDAVMDGRTSDGCKSLNKVIKPVDDPFWDRFYPLNHFKCRSTVRQLKEGEITPDDKISYPDIPKMFQVNLGKQGLAFPLDHAYFTDMPNDLK